MLRGLQFYTLPSTVSEIVQETKKKSLNMRHDETGQRCKPITKLQIV